MELLVPDAADRLGVSAGRVRDLIRSGDLPARQVAGRWFIDAADIEAAKGRPAGRPLSPRMAWGLISMVESGDAAALDRAERSKLRRRLRALPSLDQVAPLCRRRSIISRYRVHPGSLGRIRVFEPAILSGASAPGQNMIDLRGIEIYLPQAHVAHFSRTFRAQRDAPDPNVIVRVPNEVPWPFPSGVAGPAVIALDLFDSGDGRSRREARAMWEELMARRRFEDLRR